MKMIHGIKLTCLFCVWLQLKVGVRLGLFQVVGQLTEVLEYHLAMSEPQQC